MDEYGATAASERRRLAARSGHRGDVDTLRAFLLDRDDGVRATALGGLARCGALLADDLRSALGDRSAAVRRRAAQLAARHPDVPLLPLLDDPDSSVAEMAAWALGEQHGVDGEPDEDHATGEGGAPEAATEHAGERRAADDTGEDAADDAGPGTDRSAGTDPGRRSRSEAVAALSRMASGHDDPLCREAAVASLGAIGDPAGVAAILAATYDRPAIRRRAVIALAPFEGDEVDAALERALQDRDWQVRQAAEDLAD
jgi:HEAT repeat protein